MILVTLRYYLEGGTLNVFPKLSDIAKKNSGFGLKLPHFSVSYLIL